MSLPAAWSVGQSHTEEGLWVNLEVSANSLSMSPATAEQLAAFLLIAAKHVREANEARAATEKGAEA